MERCPLCPCNAFARSKSKLLAGSRFRTSQNQAALGFYICIFVHFPDLNRRLVNRNREI